MRTTYQAGEKVGSGCYLNLKNGDQVAVGGTPKALPGDETAKWLRVPWAVVVLLAPVISLAFVVFMPFIGIGMTLYVAVAAIARNLTRRALHRADVIHLDDRRAAAAAAPAALPAQPRDKATVDELAAHRNV